jgi:hypothetical protein
LSVKLRQIEGNPSSFNKTEEERKIRLQQMKDANTKGVISETERMEIPNAKAERSESVSSSQ